MKSSNTPHSLLYLWALRTLYIGEMFEPSSFTPAASSLVFALDKPLTLCDFKTGESATVRSVLIPAGVKVSVIDAGKLTACIYLDPLGMDLAMLQQFMQRRAGSLWIDSSMECDQMRVLEHIYDARTPPRDAYRMLLQRIFPGAHNAVDRVVDSRIARVVEIIRQDPVSNTSNHQLAQQVDLSDKQLERLFKQATGIPVRRYRLWHRLFVTAGYLASGQTLTDAALAAGFSDSSHFNHSFRSIVGMKPSFIFLRRHRIDMFSGGDDG